MSTTSGTGEYLGRASFALISDNGTAGVSVCIALPESLVPKEPHPWFQWASGGVLYQGQATEPPEVLPNGMVSFTLTMLDMGRRRNE